MTKTPTTGTCKVMVTGGICGRSVITGCPHVEKSVTYAARRNA